MANLGILGLGVMGRGLAQNFERRGYLVPALETPRRILMSRSRATISVVPA